MRAPNLKPVRTLQFDTTTRQWARDIFATTLDYRGRKCDGWPPPSPCCSNIPRLRRLSSSTSPVRHRYDTSTSTSAAPPSGALPVAFLLKLFVSCRFKLFVSCRFKLVVSCRSLEPTPRRWWGRRHARAGHRSSGRLPAPQLNLVGKLLRQRRLLRLLRRPARLLGGGGGGGGSGRLLDGGGGSGALLLYLPLVLLL